MTGQGESGARGSAWVRRCGGWALACAAAWALACAAPSVALAQPAGSSSEGVEEVGREISFEPEEVISDDTEQTLVSAEVGLAAGQRPERDPKNPKRFVLKPPSDELAFVGVFFARGTMTNIAVTNPLRTGLVVGRLFGSNSTTTVDDETSVYAEQRLIGFFTYAPKLLNQRAKLRAAFEVDFIYGDASNGAGANVGGAINGDQVNIQTKRLGVEVALAPGWYAVLGLQALTDNVHDPQTSDPYTILHTGYHLGFWGTDASGLVVYGKHDDWLKVKAGAYALWENVPQEDDDIWLAQLDGSFRLTETMWLGLSAWTLSERANGASGLGMRSAVAQANGAGVLTQPEIDYDYTADLYWFGVNFQRNVWFKTDRLVLDGFVMWTLGTIEKTGPEDDEGNAGPVLQEVDVLGVSALGEVAYRFGRTRNDVLSFEAIYSSGDVDLDDAQYGSVATGQLFGVPGAAFGSSRLLLLMPDLRVVNRQFGAVSDLSNGGYGLMAAVGNLQYDLVANLVTAKIGVGSAMSAVDARTNGERYIGTEVNGEVYISIDSLLVLGLHAGYLSLGSFYDSPETVFVEDEEDLANFVRPSDPWLGYASLTWVAF